MYLSTYVHRYTLTSIHPCIQSSVRPSIHAYMFIRVDSYMPAYKILYAYICVRATFLFASLYTDKSVDPPAARAKLPRPPA